MGGLHRPSPDPQHRTRTPQDEEHGTRPSWTIVVVDPADQHRYIELRCNVISTSETGALDHRDRLDAAYIGPDHHSDPADDSAHRVIVTLEAMGVHAYG